jgi:hypothetical protein
MAGSLRRDIVGLLVAHYARPHTEILTVPTRRGWRSEQGMDISRTEVDRMLEDIDPSKCGLPKDKDEWDDAKDGKKEIPDAEITTIAIDPESWLAFRDAKLKGWQPSWRERTIKAGADTSDPKPKSQ